MIFQHDPRVENAIKLSRFDSEHPLSSCSAHPIYLEDKNWLTCEHYLHIKTIASPSAAQHIDTLTTGQAASDYARPWYRRKIKGWKKQRAVLMTRAIYTKVQMYDEVREALLNTGDEFIVESSLYDYFWGIGRDLRGENTYGKILMDVRAKVKQD